MVYRIWLFSSTTHQLDGGGAGVDADMHRAALGAEGHMGHAVGHVPGMEFLVLLLVGKERRLTGISSGGGVLVQRVGHCGEFELLIRIEGGTQRPHRAGCSRGRFR